MNYYEIKAIKNEKGCRMSFWVLVILGLTIFLLLSCSTPEKSFYKKKHPRETHRGYKEKRGLMLLDNTKLGRNKYINSSRYQSKLKKSYKKHENNH
jgi:hypothetical protein